MGTAPKQTYRYAGFISYAHADEAVAARLHKALETYPVPKYLRKQGKATSPVFRDVAELTAAHSLSEKIQEAVRGSRVLIVLCSPAAKASYWVNEEIRLFRGIHGDAAILSAIIEGTQETSFPEALTEGGREPLAAALSGDKAGFKLGVKQLAAGMLGTGLDDLVQRGAKRRQKIMGAGLAASLALSGVMGFTALQAVEARNEAQSARGDAEGLVEYMIKDLKFKLEPVGRLDLLEGIGDKAVEYYDKQDIKSLPDDSLTRQAAARQVLAQVHLDAGRMKDAQREIEASAALTREVFERNPDDADAIFAHAQSEYWVGLYYFNQNKFENAETSWREYNRLGQILHKKKPNDFDYIMEAAWGQNNLGSLAVKTNKYKIAIEHLNQALALFLQAEKISPDNLSLKNEIANTLGWLADASEREGPIARALAFRDQQINHYQSYPDLKVNYAIRYKLTQARLFRARLTSLDIRDLGVTSEFEDIITELEIIYRNDPNNTTWQTTLLRAYLDYYFYTKDSKIKNRLISDIIVLKSEYIKNIGDKKTLELFYSDLVLYNNRLKQKEMPQELIEWQTIFPDDKEENWYVHSELMPFTNTPNLFAKKIIYFHAEDFKKIEPDKIQRLVEAHLLLGECEAVLKKSAHLNARGYKAPEVSGCEG